MFDADLMKNMDKVMEDFVTPGKHEDVSCFAPTFFSGTRLSL